MQETVPDKNTRPSILFVYPSLFHYPEWMHRDEVKASQLALASYLSQFYPVEYADFELQVARPSTAAQIKRFERRVRSFLQKRDFDILAISCWTSLSYTATMSTARIARELFADRLIVVGGYHPTARPDDFISDETIIDYIVRGEGELALKEIIETFEKSGRPAETVTMTGPTVHPEHFPDIDWDLVDDVVRSEFSDGISTLTVFLSRGCPFECSFCMETLKDHCWRPMSPERAIEQVRAISERYRVSGIGLGDACFGVRPEWRKEFLHRLVDLNPSSYILFETRPEYLDEEDIKLLGKLKIELQFGVESCSPTMLRLMNKSKQPEKFLERFRQTSHLLSEHGVVHGANLIFNHPGETRETLRETFAFVDSELNRGPSSLMWACHGYMHFPGSAIDLNQSFYEREFGTQFLDPRWWYGDEDPFVSSRQVIPSSDLSGDNVNLWQQMFRERDGKMRDALTPEAFQIAAGSFYQSWMSDPRYKSSN